MNLMSNEFTQQVSDIVVYGKEEANRLQNDHIEPEHLLLGILRDGECKAAEILKSFYEIYTLSLHDALPIYQKF